MYFIDNLICLDNVNILNIVSYCIRYFYNSKLFKQCL